MRLRGQEPFAAKRGTVYALYYKLLYDVKLRHKLLLSYLLLIVLPLGLFQLLASEKMSGVLERHIHYSAAQGFEQTFAFLQYKLGKMSEATDVVVVNERVIGALENQPKASADRQLEEYKSLRQFIRSFQNEDVSRVALYVPQELIYASDDTNFFPLSDGPDSECLRRMNEGKHTYLWCTPAELGHEAGTSDGHMYLTRYIRHSNNYLLPVGRVSMEVEHETVLAILSGANVVKDSVTYLLSSDNRVILSSGAAADGPPAPEPPPLPPELRSASFQVGDRLFLYHSVPHSQWTMVTSIPLRAIVSESKQLQYDLYIWVVTIAAIAYFLAYWLSHSMTRRISELVRRLRGIEKGSLNVITGIRGQDEIGVLVHTYNVMIDRIDRMNREQFKLGQEVKQAELKALQSQINPHFLYNTLDLISWLANRGMHQDIRRMIKALSRFYKLSLNQGKEMIAIRDELRHVSFYMEIQNMRFEHKIDFRIDVEEEAMPCIIPNITLQPIVENAIYHGIFERADRTGSIIVKVRREGCDLVIAVEDDGAGIEEDRLAKLARHEAVDGKPSGSGYGLRNIRLRIQQCFGEGYGLSFRSRPGGGTIVELRVPAIQEDITRIQ